MVQGPPTLNSPWHGKTALITGASSGIGAATARCLAEQGLCVILVARREERLREVTAEIEASGGQASVFPADLAAEQGCDATYQHVMSTSGCPDVLVNNAGLGWYGYAAKMDWETARELIRVNVEAMAHLTLSFLPHMVERRSGHIINVSSIAGSLPNQGVAVYGGTKSFTDSFSTALYREMRYSGVRVSGVRPGPVRTEFFGTAARQPAGYQVPAEQFAVPPEAVARAIWKLLQHPRRVVYVPWYLGLSPWLELLFGGIIDQLGPMLLRRKR